MQFTMKYQEYSTVCRAVEQHILVTSGLPDDYSMRRDIARTMRWANDFYLHRDTEITLFMQPESIMYGIVSLCWYADQREMAEEYPDFVQWCRKLALSMSDQLDALEKE